MLETYRREDVFVFYCHMTNYHKLRDVNKTTTIGNFVLLCRSEIWVGFPGFSAWHFTGLKSRYHWTRLLSGGSGEESAFKCIQGSWQNPVPCSYNSEVPIPLLSVSQGPLCSHSFSRRTPHLHLEGNNGMSRPSMDSDLSDFPLFPASQNKLCF